MSAFGFSVASLGEVWVVISICAATLVAWAAITLARRAESSVRTGTARRIGAEEAESHQHGRSSDTGDAMADSVTVTGIRIYPIKSCAGISLDRAHVTPTGWLCHRNCAARTYQTHDLRCMVSHGRAQDDDCLL